MSKDKAAEKRARETLREDVLMRALLELEDPDREEVKHPCKKTPQPS